MGGLSGDTQPEFQLSLVEPGIEMIHPYAGGGFVSMVATLAIFLQKGLNLAPENRISLRLALGYFPKYGPHAGCEEKISDGHMKLGGKKTE